MACIDDPANRPATKNQIIKLFCKSQGQHLSFKNQDIKRRLLEFIFGSSDNANLIKVTFERSFYIVLNANSSLRADQFWKKYCDKLKWIFGQNPFDSALDLKSQLSGQKSPQTFFIEIGPRPTITTPFATNAISALHASGILDVCRLEKSRRYLIQFLAGNSPIDKQKFEKFLIQVQAERLCSTGEIFDIFGDKMTECEYLESTPPTFINCLIEKSETPAFLTYNLLDPNSGFQNLKQADIELALGFDTSDFDFYLDFFRNKIGRNPTDVELFDLAQSNSEHSRHWFFKGQILVDNVDRGECLFTTIQKTQKFSNPNNVIAFSDNSSAIKGFLTKNIIASVPDSFGSLTTQDSVRHIVYTAETHNFPTGVCPFPGAATGTGGRIRDVHATGRGAHEVAGVAGYCVGNLNLLGYRQPWEEPSWNYPTTSFALPSKILLEASDGASDYGNKFGEPLISGFTRTFGLKVPGLVDLQTNLSDNPKHLERLEYVKPIMFSGGIGLIDDIFLYKEKCGKGQIVAKIGGPVYRIGVGGGAASSCSVQGTRNNFVDFGAVQRGDPEMEHKLHRVIRSCVEFGSKKNPILSIHDQGAGGNGNVLKEIVEGEHGGAQIDANAFELGDSTISLRELWGAEYQESDAVLLDPDLIDKVERIAKRERCTVSLVGCVTGDQRIVLKEFSKTKKKSLNIGTHGQFPVDLNLKQIAEREPKVFNLYTFQRQFQFEAVSLPVNFSVYNALELVLRLPSVASKRFLTSKVDRSVTGLIAQQQCVGGLQTPLADVAVTAHSYYNCVGSALACGEQPIKGIINAGVGARMAVGEALTNLVFAPITCLQDVKCSGNWMWAAKLPGEGARLVAACEAMCAVMNTLGIAVDGGKDSLSMAARVTDKSGNNEEIVKAPGTLVISAYAPCTNITKIVTPDFKPKNGVSMTLLYLRMGKNCSYAMAESRLGGSALAQCLCQIGNKVADLDDAVHFKKCFQLIQEWINAGFVVSGHDVSDGGLLVAILESAFAGNCGVVCNFDLVNESWLAEERLKMLFSEELGVILEVAETVVPEMFKSAKFLGIESLCRIGKTVPDFGHKAKIEISMSNVKILDALTSELREIWEETSDRMEALQLLPKCIEEQSSWRFDCNTSDLKYRFNFDFLSSLAVPCLVKDRPRVAILREEGSNGDREMAAAFLMVGFDAYDVTMTDLLESAGKGVDLLNAFCGLAFVGGFSYADVFGSARGWAASILFNPLVRKSLEDFRRRLNTFSLGVCNGCQLMALLGFIGENDNSDATSCNNSDQSLKTNVFLDENKSGRFYSGFNAVLIEHSPSLFLRGMEESVLGVWCSHGEGRFTYRNDSVQEKLKAQNLIALRYCNATGQPTMRYPENPNGSVDAVAGISSADGRHLALMPHPDRSFLSWQCPTKGMKPKTDYLPNSIPVSPWIRLFKNAFVWTLKNK